MCVCVYRVNPDPFFFGAKPSPLPPSLAIHTRPSGVHGWRDPTSHADFGAATHPGGGGGTHRRRATFDRC